MTNTIPTQAIRSQSPLKVVNLLGAPGVGKSGVAAGLFHLMKARHCSVELCREYAKYLVITDRSWQLREEQLYLFAKQHHELFILRGQYDIAITDSPLLLTAYYAPSDATPPSFYQCVREYNDTFDNAYFYMSRALDNNAVFEDRGRIHNREQSIQIDQSQRQFLTDWNVPYIDVPISGDNTPERMFEILQAKGWC